MTQLLYAGGGGGAGHNSQMEKDDFALQNLQNSIGSAPRREADSQPISPLARPAVSRTKTHRLGFLSVADAAPSSREIMCLRASSGRMVRNQYSRRFEPRSGGYKAAAAADDSQSTRIRTTDLTTIRTADLTTAIGCVTIQRRLMWQR